MLQVRGLEAAAGGPGGGEAGRGRLAGQAEGGAVPGPVPLPPPPDREGSLTLRCQVGHNV